jgi:hypothetical protein
VTSIPEWWRAQQFQKTSELAAALGGIPVYDSIGVRLQRSFDALEASPQWLMRGCQTGVPVWGLIRLKRGWSIRDRYVPLANARIEDGGVYLAYTEEEIWDSVDTYRYGIEVGLGPLDALKKHYRLTAAEVSEFPLYSIDASPAAVQAVSEIVKFAETKGHVEVSVRRSVDERATAVTAKGRSPLGGLKHLDIVGWAQIVGAAVGIAALFLAIGLAIGP